MSASHLFSIHTVCLGLFRSHLPTWNDSVLSTFQGNYLWRSTTRWISLWFFFSFRKGTFWSNCVNILPQEKIHRNVTKSWTGKVVCCLDDANENNCSNVNGTMVQHAAWLPWSNSLCPFLKSYFVLSVLAQTSSHSPKTLRLGWQETITFSPLLWYPGDFLSHGISNMLQWIEPGCIDWIQCNSTNSHSSYSFGTVDFYFFLCSRYLDILIFGAVLFSYQEQGRVP